MEKIKGSSSLNSMKATVEELVLSGVGISHAHGEIYELLGLDVIYDRDSLKIYSTRKARIKSISSGIHIHANYEAIDLLITKGLVGDYEYSMPLERVDLMGNKIVVAFTGRGGIDRIAIVTSGGDAPGMNSAIESIIRMDIKWGASVHGVYKGYDGLINDNIRKLSWETETYNCSQGGTALLSARSKRFMDNKGRMQAVLNMIRKGINCMVEMVHCKEHLLPQKFRDHFRTLIKEGKVSNEEIRKLFSDRDRNRNKVDGDQNTTDGNGPGYSDFYGRPECYKASPNVYRELNSSGSEGEGEGVVGRLGPESGVFTTKNNEDMNIEQCIYGLKVVTIPATIDNDIYGAAVSLGEDTAINRVSP